MGIHISLVHRYNLDEHPEWDFTRYQGDREFVNLEYKLAVKTIKDGEYWRPLFFNTWREKIKELPYPERFNQLLDILEKDEREDWWIYISR